MAKYTELFSEYIENGGDFPAVFDNITGFKDLFIGEYCDREIGFETPVLFSIKLETRANLIVPAYVERIAEIQKAIDNLSDPTKKRVRSGSTAREYGERNYTDTDTKNGSRTESGTDTHTIVSGDREETHKDYPFADLNANDPTAGVSQSVKVHTDNDTDTNEHNNTETFNEYEDNRTYHEDIRTDTETYNNVTDTESGYTASEAAALFTALENQVFIIKRELLKEFNSLFMVVY